MQFSVRAVEEKYEAKWWLEDDQNTIFRFELPENSIPAWRVAAEELLKYFANDPLPDGVSFSKCKLLHDSSNEEYCQQDAALERVAFCKFLLALEREGQSSESKIRSLEIFQNHPQIAALFGECPYCFLFLKAREDAFLPVEERDEQVWGFYLDAMHRSHLSDDWVADLVSHYDLLREFAYQACRHKPEQALRIAQNYAALVKAILHFLDVIQQDVGAVSTTNSSVTRRLSQKYSPRLAALLVENESLNLDERQEYLNFILQRMPYQDRFALLQNILTDLIEDVQENPNNNEAMQTIASLMSQHYLNRYDLDKAVLIWEQVLNTQQSKKDWILRTLLRLYKHPRYFIVLLVIFIAFSFLPFVGAVSSFLLLAVFFLVLLFGLLTVAAHFLKKQGFSYLELFLPRLFGSIVVGLSILALENTVWEITLDMPWGNWALTTLAAYLGSMTYLFLDIHKHTRLLTEEAGSNENELDSSKSKKQGVSSKPMARSVETTFKIFAIGLLEAVGLTTIVSALIPFNALGETFQSTLADGKALAMWGGITLKVLSNHVLIYQIFGAERLSLTYFPKLIVLWAGLSLLIGAFVQLLWQDRQITAS